MHTFTTTHRQQVDTRQCLTIWQLILTLITWLSGPAPVVCQMKRESAKPRPLTMFEKMGADLDLSLAVGHNLEWQGVR